MRIAPATELTWNENELARARFGGAGFDCRFRRYQAAELQKKKAHRRFFARSVNPEIARRTVPPTRTKSSAADLLRHSTGHDSAHSPGLRTAKDAPPLRDPRGVLAVQGQGRGQARGCRGTSRPPFLGRILPATAGAVLPLFGRRLGRARAAPRGARARRGAAARDHRDRHRADARDRRAIVRARPPPRQPARTPAPTRDFGCALAAGARASFFSSRHPRALSARADAPPSARASTRRRSRRRSAPPRARRRWSP